MQNYSIILPLKKDVLKLAFKHTIPSLLSFLKFNKLYIITKDTKDINTFKEHPQIVFLEEDDLIKDLKIKQVQDYLLNRINDSKRSGWYFQQFLKLGFSLTDYAQKTEHYLVWDADSILFKPIDFFNKHNQTYITITESNEYHKPYFNTSKKLLNTGKEFKSSFISEHLMFNVTFVNELISIIDSKDNEVWWKIILNHIDKEDLPKSGFSEYETYGNYVYTNYTDTFSIRKLKHLRDGTVYLGKQPNNLELKLFSKYYDFISFETWQHKINSPIKRYLAIYKLLTKSHK